MGLLYKLNLRQKILIKKYNNPLSGYYGLAKIVELLLYKYYWLRLRQEVKEYISHYKKCQVYKIYRHKLWGLLKSISPANKLWRYYTMDFITDFLPFKDK